MKKYFVGFCVMIASAVSAQSYHFSQFFSTPLLTNPAHTGFTDGPYRISSNFRSQGNPGSTPYFTGYVSADVSPLEKYLPAGHKAGLGMYIMSDKSLGGALQVNTIAMSAAYDVGLDKQGITSLGIGLQGTYNQRRIDYTKLSFGNQFGGTGYDPSLPVGEALPSSSTVNKSYFDANAGIIYSYLKEKKGFFAGASVYNILRHQDNILPDEFKMPTRYTVQAGARFVTADNGRVYISLTHMNQAKANETTIGGAYGVQLNKDATKNEVDFGLWYRYKDAVIPYVGYQVNGFQVGLSYDYSVSSIKTGSEVRNAYELTLLFSALNKQHLETSIPWY